jgi:hypothetical protein
MKIFNKRFLVVVGFVMVILLSCAANIETEKRSNSSSGDTRFTGSGNIQYSYERSDNIRFDFVQRQKAFTSDEIKAIKEVLDKLPDAFLGKVIASGVKKFYRVAKLPRKTGDLFLEEGDDTAVAVPPGGFIAFADSAFSREHADLYKIVVHHTAHCVQWREAGNNALSATPFTWISWTGKTEPFGYKTFNGFVSNYARTNHREDYAETCVYYWLDPDKLRKVNPEKFAYMRDKVFGTISSSDSRKELADIIFVMPYIESLGDASDEVYSFVSIKGKNFMGPFDGGYNRVRFGGSIAQHVPVSNTVIWAWVPDVTEGDKPVTVTTQDGTSNAFPFYVTGDPWWKYW